MIDQFSSNTEEACLQDFLAVWECFRITKKNLEEMFRCIR